MSAREKAIEALREIRAEGVTSLRAVYLIDEALTALESEPTEEQIRKRTVADVVEGIVRCRTYEGVVIGALERRLIVRAIERGEFRGRR